MFVSHTLQNHGLPTFPRRQLIDKFQEQFSAAIVRANEQSVYIYCYFIFSFYWFNICLLGNELYRSLSPVTMYIYYKKATNCNTYIRKTLKDSFPDFLFFNYN